MTAQRHQGRSRSRPTDDLLLQLAKIANANPRCWAASQRVPPRHTHTASERRITRDGDPMHTPPLTRIIVERAMLGAAVVPDRQRTNLPAESACKLRLNGMRHQKIENRPRLGVLEPFERLRVI